MRHSMKEVLANYEVADTLATVTSFALQAALDGEIEWLRQGDYSAGIVRADSASGGVVIIRSKNDKFPRVHYLEKWCADTNARTCSLLGQEYGNYYQEWSDMRELARRVMNVRNDILARGGK